MHYGCRSRAYGTRTALPTRAAKLDGRIIAQVRNEGARDEPGPHPGPLETVKGKVKEQWGSLTDDDLDVIAGRRDQLLGRIQQRHGLARGRGRRQVSDWEGRNPEFRLDDESPR